MRKIITAALLLMAGSAMAQVHVSGYTKKDGTYVAPHERTAPNNTMLDNYSTKGNVNPYTGQAGTKEPYPEPSAYAYPAPRPQPSPTLQPARPLQPSQTLTPPVPSRQF